MRKIVEPINVRGRDLPPGTEILWNVAWNILLVPLIVEFFFRGVLQSALARTRGAAAVPLAAIIYGFTPLALFRGITDASGTITMILVIFLLGILLGGLMHFSRSVLVPLLLWLGWAIGSIVMI